MKPWCVTKQMKAVELYFHMMLFVSQYSAIKLKTLLVMRLVKTGFVRVKGSLKCSDKEVRLFCGQS